MEIIQDLRAYLTESDLETIATIVNKKEKKTLSSPVDAVRVKLASESDSMAAFGSDERAIQKVIKYYLTLKELNESIVKGLSRTGTDSGQQHFTEAVKQALRDIDVHLGNLDRDNWYISYGPPQ